MASERLICPDQYTNFDQWELLAAIQAVILYTIMRLVEGETENTDFDEEMIWVVEVSNILLLHFQISCLPNWIAIKLSDLHPTRYLALH